MEYILIADDNKDITDILEKYVKKEGYGALIATDGIQTEELFHTYHPAAILLDVMMPGENGIDTAREIRRYDTAVQIIFVTSSSEFAVQSYVVGAYYYQLKPIWKDSFFRLTDAVLAECRKRTQHSLILRCKSGVTRITLDRLEYCEVQGRTLGGAGGSAVPPTASAGAAGGRAAVHPAAAAAVHPLRCALHAAAFPLPGLGAVPVRYRAAGGLSF